MTRLLPFLLLVASPLTAQERPTGIATQEGASAIATQEGASGTAAQERASGITAQERPFGTLREQAALRQEWLRLRLERVLPRLMREHGVDMWIVPMREYNEDPVFRALVSPTT
ncbi:MAG TPA: hypothetical protein VF192_11515, partial [Longimicrobiales bacterium]